jgi:hypothetical protein
MRDVKRLISEIIDKEYEKHELLYLGFPRISFDLANNLFLKIGNVNDFSELHGLIKIDLYRQIDYPSFVEVQKRTDFHAKFSKTLKLFLQQELARLQKKENRSKLDTNIGLGKNVSFFLSTMLFSGIYKIFRESNVKFETPSELKKFFTSLALNTFPIEFQAFLEQLKKEDDEFWTIVYKLLEKLSTTVTNIHIWSSIYKDIAKDEIASESYIELNRKVINDAVLFDDSMHFRKYSYRICENKMHEYKRKNRMDDLTGSMEDNIELKDKQQEEVYEDDYDQNWESVEIDVNNQYQLARLAAIILLNSSHPLHKQLIDCEDKSKIELLIDVSVNDLSYDEIIEERAGNNNLSDEDKKRMNANLRQEYSRIKKTVIKRLKTILEDNEKMYSYRK